MKKILLMAIFLVAIGTTAACYVGDEAQFSVELNTIPCEFNECGAWDSNLATYVYGGYVLQNPNGIIVYEHKPEMICEDLPIWTPSLDYTVDMEGTWRFTAISDILFLYTDNQCGYDIMHCGYEIKEIEVKGCNPEDFQDAIEDSFYEQLS